MLEQAILEHAAALNNLADAIKASVPANLALAESYRASVLAYSNQNENQLPLNFTPAADKPAEKQKKQKEDSSSTKVEEAVGPFYWEDTETEYFGKEESIKALNKQLATKDSIKQIGEARFNELATALRERNAKAQEKMKAEKEAPVEKASTQPADSVPSVEDVIAVFTKYLPKDLDAEERKARHAVVKPLLAKYGADKATNLKPEHRAEAIAFIEGKLAELEDEVV